MTHFIIQKMSFILDKWCQSRQIISCKVSHGVMEYNCHCLSASLMQIFKSNPFATGDEYPCVNFIQMSYNDTLVVKSR